MLAALFHRTLALITLATAALSLGSCGALADESAAEQRPDFRYVIRTNLNDLPDTASAEASVSMETSMAFVRRRLEGHGILVHSIAHDGNGVITLEISGENSEASLSRVGAIGGKIDFRMIDVDADPQDTEEEIAPPGSEILPLAYDPETPVVVRLRGGLTGSGSSARLT